MKYAFVLIALLGCGADSSNVTAPTAEPDANRQVPSETATATAPTAVVSATAQPSASASATATATATATAVASVAPTATASAAPAGPAPLEGANVNIGSFGADGLSLKDISCKAEGGGLGGLLGSMTIAAGLSKRKAALDKCGKAETRVHIWQKGGKVTKAEVVGESKIGPCIQKALVGAPATVDSECLLTVVHGK
jgi:hypothetical protein